MKLTKEQFEDIITVGEAKASADNKEFRLHLVRETPNLNEKIDTTKTVRYLGYIFYFKPGKDFDFCTYLDTQVHGETAWIEPKSEGWWGSLEDFYEEAQNVDLLLSYKGQRYASWDPFAKVFGVTKLVAFGTKIPRALAVRLQRVCEQNGETPSWCIRMLIQDYLMEQIKNGARQVLFEG